MISMPIKFHWMHRNGWDNNKHDIIKMAIDLDNENIASVLLPYGPNGLDYLLHVPTMINSTKNINLQNAISIPPAFLFSNTVSIVGHSSVNDFV